MMNLLFSPSGRINPSEFMKGVLVLVVISIVLGLLPLLSPALGSLAIIGIVLLWCWVVLWVKRYHDAGKSGWMCLIPIIVYLVVAMIIGQVLASMFVDPAFQESVNDAAASGDFSAILEAAMSGTGGMTKTGVLVNTLVGAAISYGIAFLFNNMIKREPNDNRFGPAS